MTQLDWKVRLREMFNPSIKPRGKAPRLSQLPKPSAPKADKNELNAPTKNPSEPTGCRPGSWAKIEVMRQRYERGEYIHHDLDSRDALTEYEAKSDTQNNPYRNGLLKGPTVQWS